MNAEACINVNYFPFDFHGFAYSRRLAHRNRQMTVRRGIVSTFSHGTFLGYTEPLKAVAEFILLACFPPPMQIQVDEYSFLFSYSICGINYRENAHLAAKASKYCKPHFSILSNPL